MKKRFMQLLLCVICLFWFNTNVSASTTQVKSGKTTYYLKESSISKIYKKTSGKEKVLLTVKSNEHVTNVLCVYKNALYYTKSITPTEGSDYSCLMKYNLKTKKNSTIKKIASYGHSALYKSGRIYLTYNADKYKNHIYNYNLKTKKYSKFLSFKASKKISDIQLLGTYNNYMYASLENFNAEWTEFVRINLKSKKITSIKKWNGLKSMQFHNGSIAITHGYLETIYLGNELTIYNCKKNSLKTVRESATCPTYIDSKWYYVAQDGSTGKIYVMRCDLNGKNQKKLKQLSDKFLYVEKITKHSITYTERAERSEEEYDEEVTRTVKF